MPTLIIFAVILIFSFIGCRSIVQSTPYYKTTDALIYETKKDSCLFKEVRDGYLMDVVSYYTFSEDFSVTNKKVQLRLTIVDFINYINDNISEARALEVSKKYDETRLLETMVYDNIPMFIFDVSLNRIVENDDCRASSQYYIDKFYAPFIDEYCQGYLFTIIPNYYEFTKYQNDMLLYAELLPSFIFAGIVTFFVPIFIFKRGRKTIGKLVYKISVVDSKFLSPKLGRVLTRQSIYLFGIIFLSIFTFLIPALISFSMMTFSKNKQGFADYMLGLREIDTSNQKAYFSLDEAMIEHLKSIEKHTDFTLREND